MSCWFILNCFCSPSFPPKLTVDVEKVSCRIHTPEFHIHIRFGDFMGQVRPAKFLGWIGMT